MECMHHLQHKVIKVCFSCGDELVCKLCADGAHYGHIFREFTDIGPERKHSIDQHLTELGSQAASVKSFLEDLDSLRNDTRKKTADAFTLIKRRGDDLKEAVDNYVKQLTYTCEQQQIENENEIDPINENATREYQHIQDIIRILESASQSNKAANIVSVEKQHRQAQHTFNTFSLPKTNTYKFIHGQGSSSQLRSIFGNLDQMSTITQPKQIVCDPEIPPGEPMVTSSFEKTIIGHTAGVCALEQHAIDDSHSWIRYERCRDVFLANQAGQAIKMIEFDSSPAAIAILSDNRTIVTCPDERCLREILPNNQTKELFSTERLIPRALCMSIEGNIIVSLVEKWTFSLTPSSVRKVTRLNMRGHRKEEAELDSHRQRLFIKPAKMNASKVSGDIAIINWTDHESSHLVVLDTHLQLKYRYFGDGKVVPGFTKFSGKYRSDFCPQDVAYDPMDRILISELYSGAIQMVSKAGRFLKILHIDEDIPWSLTIHRDGQIWVGYNTGKVNVIKYCKYTLK